MEKETAEFLISEPGRELVAEAAKLIDERTELHSALSRLAKLASSELVRAAWKAAEIRRRAFEKIGDEASVLLFDQDGYEMASGFVTSTYHGRLLQEAGASNVVDLCAGVGLDTIAFAKLGIKVTSFELDPGRALLLSENLKLLGLSENVEVVQTDCTTAALPKADFAYFDPARRTGHRRWVSDDQQTLPPLFFIRDVEHQGVANIIAKLSPAVNREIASEYTGDLQFVSVKGECKEALLLIGSARDHSGRSAVLLPCNDKFSSTLDTILSENHGAFLWEPDPAVIRAGLTGSLASSLGGWLCDPHVDYFFTDQPGQSPFADCYRVVNELPYSRRGLSEALSDAGSVVLKQRAFPQSIDDVRAKLKLTGKQKATVVLTSFFGQAYVFVVEKVS